MNKEELVAQCQWTDDVTNECSLHLPIPIFETTVEFEIYSDITKQGDLSDTVVTTINDVLALNENSLSLIKRHLWEECKFMCTESAKSEPLLADETPYEAKLRTLDIHDCEAAYKKSRLIGVFIEETEHHDDFTHRYATLNFEPHWGGPILQLIIQDGQLIARYRHDAYLGWYEAGDMFDPNTSESPLLSKNLPSNNCSSLVAPKFQ